jgi:ATP:ADP antiporter, AAA family
MGFFFLVVCAVGMLRPIKNSLALDGLGATDFYKVYLVSAAAMLVVPPYNRLAERVSARWLIPGVALFFAFNLVLFWVYYREGSAVYGMLFYGWYDLFAAALVTQFFMATQHFFDPRSAKNAFPLIVAGGAVGATVGGAVTGLFAQTLGTPNLLLVAAVLVLLFGVGLPFAWVEEATRFTASGVRRVEQLTASGLRTVFANPQVRLIAATVLLAVVVKQLIDYQFNVITKEVFQTRDAVAAFQGQFNAATQWLPIVVVLALRPLMRRWGVGVAVLLLPVFMLLTTFGMALWWGLVTVLAAKAAETGLRYSAERTGREVLYVPVPAEIKLKAKAYIDIAIEKGLGKVLGAAVIFVLLAVGSRGVIATVSVLLCVLWVLAAAGVRREYVRTLARSIQGRSASLRGLSASLTDASTLPVIQQALTGGDTLQTAFTLDLIDQAAPADVRSFAEPLHGLLESPSAGIRQRAIASLARAPEAVDPVRLHARLADPAAPVREAAVRALCLARPGERAQLLERLLGSPEARVRTAALASLARGDFGDNGAEGLGRSYLESRAQAAWDGARDARLEVALGVGIVPASGDVRGLLDELLGDPDAEVAAAALGSAARLRGAAHHPAMIAALARPAVREAARSALAQQGHAVLPALAAALLDEEGDAAVRRAIPSVMARIPTQDSVELLFRSLLAPETDQLLDFRTLKALSKLHAHHPELRFDPERVRLVLDREVQCARRFLEAELLLAEPAAAGRRCALLRQALREAVAERREGVFRCLGLLHDPQAMYRCYLAVQCGRRGPRATALEWLEQTVGYTRFAALAPVLGEPARSHGPAASLSPVLAALCAEEDAWIARCAAAAAAELDPVLVGGDPARLRVPAGPRLRYARQADTRALAAVGPEPSHRPIPPNPGSTPMDAIEKVFLLQGVDLLQGARSAHLALLASIAEEFEADPGALLLRRDEPPDALFVVIRGAVELHGLGGQTLVAREGTAFGTWALIDESPSLVEARAAEPTRLLRIERSDLFDLLADYPELSVGLLQGLARRIRTLVA